MEGTIYLSTPSSFQLAKKADVGVLAFGTIDSWLVWQLTRGK